jgi:hypothetical protein
MGVGTIEVVVTPFKDRAPEDSTTDVSVSEGGISEDGARITESATEDGVVEAGIARVGSTVAVAVCATVVVNESRTCKAGFVGAAEGIVWNGNESGNSNGSSKGEFGA